MAALLITYDLHDKQYEDDLLKFIKDDGSWAFISESSYVVVRNETTASVVAAIRAIVHDKIELLVVNIVKPFNSHGLRAELVAWLSRYVP
jgi:hypothetical protein